MPKGRAVSGSGATVALALAAAAWLAFPWYGLESGLPGAGRFGSALIAAMGGRWWLLPLALPLLTAAIGLARSRSRWLTASACVGLLWLLLEAFAAPAQPALGWGALLYVGASLVLIAYGLARQGWCRGDAFTVGAILLVCTATLVFVAYPVACILASAFRDDAGHLALGLFAEKLTSSSIWGLACLSGGRSCGVAWNALTLAILVGVLTTLLGLAFALISARTALRLKPLLRVMSILPVITPPFVIGLALILLFGRNGIVTTFLSDWLDLPRSRWLYGLPGLVIAQLLAFTPIAYLVLLGVLSGVSPSMEEAAQTLRAGRWRTFRTVTWPLIRPGLANAFLIGFIESLADFGNPMVLGGNFRVLSTAIYFAVVGAAQDQGQAAVLAIVLLAFSLTAFVMQRLWLGRRSYVTVAGKGDSGIPARLPSAIQAACYAVTAPWVLLTVAVYGVILLGGFVKAVGTDNQPTLEYLLTAFRIERGEHGWFLAGSAWNSLLTTLEVALLSMPLTAALGILTAYLLNRQRFAGQAAFEFLTMLSFAIPGTVIGVSYILAFNVPPIELTGTGLIMMIAFVFR
ncbi:MAG: iron ABC transporter permease, partial [Acetobacteraceae bacterium]|nr:iron ABC transporter permease [Acetobacteraceae bacterium]